MTTLETALDHQIRIDLYCNNALKVEKDSLVEMT
jgi:hypothetical protein